MAEAVEGSYVVLMCFAPEYERSENCRREAEYCAQLKVPFVPLILSPGYSPQGWLGILKGQKLYYDFSNPLAFDISLKGVLNEIERIQSAPAGTVDAPPQAQAQAPRHGSIVASPLPPAPTPTAGSVAGDPLLVFLTAADAADAYETCTRNRVDVPLLREMTAQEMFTMGIAFGSAKRIVAHAAK